MRLTAIQKIKIAILGRFDNQGIFRLNVFLFFFAGGVLIGSYQPTAEGEDICFDYEGRRFCEPEDLRPFFGLGMGFAFLSILVILWLSSLPKQRRALELCALAANADPTEPDSF